MKEGFKVNWSVALIVAGIMVLFVAAELFRRTGEGVRPGAEASAWAFSIGVLFFALGLIVVGIYLTRRQK